MNRLIQCKNLTLQYDRHIAVQNVSFSVEPGDFLCIIGENGSGKSTLLKGLLGLLPPHDGQVSYAPTLSRTAIGYVPQQSTVQRDFPATVWEIVLSGCLARRGEQALVLRCRKKAGPCILGTPWHRRFVPSKLPCPFRRPAATGFAGARTMRRGSAVLLRRACHRARSESRCFSVSALAFSLQTGYGHHHGIA